MDSIIDAHSHLGDIFYPNGGQLIGEKGATKRAVFDPISIWERALFWNPLGVGKTVYDLFGRWVTRGEHARNFTATLENFNASMQESGITHSVCLPIPPYVSFSDLAPAAEAHQGVIPFTGVDYTTNDDPGPKLAADVRAGARGLKLHPILQQVPLTSGRTRTAVEAFGAHDLPVLFHCGISQYFLGEEKKKQEPRYGDIQYAARLVRDFPAVSFIAGHAGLFEVRDVMRKLGDFGNVWVDTSFQSVPMVRELIATFGPERVLFGSDWPFGNRPPALATVRAACRGDSGLERRILFDNAAELLHMS